MRAVFNSNQFKKEMSGGRARPKAGQELDENIKFKNKKYAFPTSYTLAGMR